MAGQRQRPTPAQRVAALEKFTPAEVMAIALRVQRAKNPLNAATTVSAAEILALTEMVVRADGAAEVLTRMTP